MKNAAMIGNVQPTHLRLASMTRSVRITENILSIELTHWLGSQRIFSYISII